MRETRGVDIGSNSGSGYSQEYFNTVINTSQDAIIAVDSNGRITIYNTAAEHTFGWTAAEMLGGTLDRILPAGSEHEHAKNFNAYFSTGVPSAAIGKTLRLEARHKSGRHLPIELSLAAGNFADGRFAVAVLRDVTDRQNMETQLRQSERLQSIGTLAAGIAHEINSPSQFANDNISFLQQSYTNILALLRDCAGILPRLHPDPEASKDHAELCSRLAEADLDFLSQEIPVAIGDALEGIKRITGIVKAMKAFAHPGSNEKTLADINRNIQDTVTVCRNEWKYVSDLEMNLASDLPPVSCLVAEINQVLLNLITNAAHAIGDVVEKQPGSKGRITISTRRDGNCVLIEIKDSGSGIPQELHQRIFDPFFTTKKPGKGTGQGLAISRSVIVDKHGGSMSVESSPGQGAVFSLRLPFAVKGEEDKGHD